VDALKRLPWRSLLLSTALAIIAIKIIEFVLSQGFVLAPAFFGWTTTSLGSLFLDLGGGLAFGRIGVLFLQRFERFNANYIPTRWGLVLCLLISFLICSQIVVGPILLIAETPVHLIGVLVGVFWNGK
jgi:hypothetical protein